jgi:hypothetical protein
MHAGHEKLRFITGFATAIHADGRTVTISLRDIYDRAREVRPGPFHHRSNLLAPL